VKLGAGPEVALERLEKGDFRESDVVIDPSRRASDDGYEERVRAIDAPTPARFNADPGRLHEASGCAGKLAVFAVRLDTFPKDERTATFYIGTNDPDELTELRRRVLSAFESLPVAGEYMHRECFDIADQYGKDTFLAIRSLGTDRLPALFRLKAMVDAAVTRLGIARAGFSDRWLQRGSRLLPRHLPKRLYEFRDRYAHHLILKMPGDGIEEAASLLEQMFPSSDGDYFRCSDEEATAAFLHRFAAAGAAIRYRTMHSQEVEGIVALDVALPRNTIHWVEKLPASISGSVVHSLYYGHFFCQVFHQDYIVRKGIDLIGLEHEMCRLLDERDAEYPAEHNVGHLYPAKPALSAFYRQLDPTNAFNPGIGQTSRHSCWQGDEIGPGLP
jgi:D-lactate dehydrogenase